jgi:predicted RNA binding protein YcfA (HicA-like mRNA interferase family)
VSKVKKVYEKLMSRQSDPNFTLDDLCYLLAKLGFALRHAQGSHIIAQRGPAYVNVQNKGGKAKAYQVEQVRNELKKHNIKPE